MSKKITKTNQASITSREIAELAGKRHDHVMRDIRAIAARLSLDQNPNWYCKTEIYADGNGRNRECFRLNRDSALTIITQYEPAARLAVFSRIERLSLHELLSGFDAQDLPPDRFIYVAMERESKRYKVGISKNPEKRVADLSRGHPEGLVLMAIYTANLDGYLSEIAAHQYLAEWRLNGEWFSADAPVHQLPKVLS
jgi:hypothetical protein